MNEHIDYPGGNTYYDYLQATTTVPWSLGNSIQRILHAYLSPCIQFTIYSVRYIVCTVEYGVWFRARPITQTCKVYSGTLMNQHLTLKKTIDTAQFFFWTGKKEELNSRTISL